MTAPRDHLLARVRQWVDFADEDLRMACHALTMSQDCPYRLVAYHAQQCAEKHLKAFLVSRSVEFPFTHNISLLLELCAEHGRWAQQLTPAEELSPFAVSLRYPGPSSEVSAVDAEKALDLARRVRDVVQGVLQQEHWL